MSILGEVSYALISSPRSQFGGIIPDVIVEEVYRDSIVVTDHPVERGAAITDHAFKRPSAIEMRCGFSNSTAGDEGYIVAVYAAMIQLQQARQPFDVFTPRRMYRNMLLSDISVTREDKTNSVLSCSVTLREVILTSTQSASSDASNLAQPEKTASETDSGTKQPTTDDTSAPKGNVTVRLGTVEDALVSDASPPDVTVPLPPEAPPPVVPPPEIESGGVSFPYAIDEFGSGRS